MPQKNIEAKVRPLGNPSLEKASLFGAARLFVSKDSLVSLTGSLENGKVCIVERLSVSDAPACRRQAALWVLQDKNVSPNVVMMSRAFQEATGFKIGDQVRISMADEPVAPDAEEVVVKDTAESAQEVTPSLYADMWKGLIAFNLDRAEQVYPGMTLEGINVLKIRRTFKVISVNGKDDSLARFNLEKDSIRVIQPGEETPQINSLTNGSSAPTGGELTLKNVPGISGPVNDINDFLDIFSRPFHFPGECVSCGFVIQGGRGTGKTFILQGIAATNWGKAHWIRPSDKLARIREVFQQAPTQQPCMILIDDLEGLIAQDRTNREAIIETLREELDALSARVEADGVLPRIPIIVTCSDYTTDVPPVLQESTRLCLNVTLTVPRVPERLELLRHFDPPLHPDVKESCLAEIAQKTHAYNARDLKTLVTQAKWTRTRRLRRGEPLPEDAEQQYILPADMELARTVIRPTAMHDVNLQPPIINWADIGGQDSVKKVLSRMIRNSKETSTRRIFKPSKGLLLYGPPGCSKTLSAQAMATESSFNFFAVKGAELLNMYVGESERAVRSLFNRARAASPSIIFFDEIDSIGGQRQGGNGGGSSAGKSSGSVNMITTLLTEMDGFEDLRGVIVIAATNRPESMDPALLRPGRFDKVVYVGPPDLAAREAVFRVHLRGMPLADDVDIPALARESKGHSGAEIKNICNSTAEAVQERFDEEEEDDETGTAKLEIRMEDLLSKLRDESRRITPEMVKGYETWAKQFKDR